MSEQIISQETRNILGLQLPTDPRWVNLAELSLEAILCDHAWCEQKAAITCMSMIQRYPDKTELVKELAPVVTEEWGHFRLVFHEIQKRGFTLTPPRKDAYVNGLMAFVQKGGHPDGVFLDKLLLMGMIEARSCERFKRLSEGLQDSYLSSFYRRFMESEAGHYKMFLDLAMHYLPKEHVRSRWEEWLHNEAVLMNSIEVRGDRIH